MIAFRLEVVDSCGSTNEELLAKRQEPNFHGRCLLALHQTGGRGRRGRSWWSGEGNLALSLGLHFAHPSPLIPLLPFYAGLALWKTLKPLLPNEDLRLKWPNDLYLNGRKLAGMLTQVRQMGDASDLVLGIGLNLASAPPGEEAVALEELVPAPKAVDFATAYLPALASTLTQHDDFLALRTAWEEAARLEGTSLEILDENVLVSPLALLPTGELEVQMENGETRALASETVSLRLR